MASNYFTRNNNYKSLHSSLLNTSNKKSVIGGDEVHIDKKRKVGSDKMVVTARGGRTRHAFSDLNGSQDVVPEGASISNLGTECEGGIEFTKEDVEALLNEKSKVKGKWKDKERCDEMKDYIRRLRLCVRHYQQVEGNYEIDSENLRKGLESSEKHCAEIELELKNNVEGSNSIIMELRKNYGDVQEKLCKEEAEKLDVMESLDREREARIESDKSVVSLSEELGKTQRDLEMANQKILGLTETHRRAQDYNISIQQYNCKLQADLEAANDNLKRLEIEKTTITENLSALRVHNNLLQEQLTAISASYDEVTKQKDELINEVAWVRKDLQQTKDDYDHQILQLKEKCALQIDRITTLEDKLTTAEKKAQMCGLSALETQAEFESLNKLTNDLQIRLTDAESKMVEGEILRKHLHNTILELKGNIRVFCRVRPLLVHEKPHKEGKVTSFPTSVELLGRGIELMQNGQKHSFTFDKVFMPDATQEDVFTEISELIQSALDGYKVCIFAYGQTGSGKTHTMMGKPGNQEEKGLIPRSFEKIFQTRQFLESQGWVYEMQVSMLEIYNETIRDLLSRSSNNDPSNIENSAGKQYAIKHDANGNTYVSDLTVVDVQNIEEVSVLLEQAALSRSIGKTQMNEYSSRSHFVFTLRIFGVNKSTGQHAQGVLNLIDLAGSERISKSGSTGDRLKETQAINKSLASLGDVIFALGKKEDHIPFRHSKLTYLLQPYLGGDSKTLMFVNISPDPSSFNESLCSLRFGARVNSCQVGTAKRQTNTRSSDSRLSYG